MTETKKQVTIGRYLFSFRDKQEWVAKAQSYFGAEGYRAGETICIDQQGRICTHGKQFIQAERDGTYPIDVYVIREDADMGMLAKIRAGKFVEARLSGMTPQEAFDA